jgi:hypothetical protein
LYIISDPVAPENSAAIKDTPVNREAIPVFFHMGLFLEENIKKSMGVTISEINEPAAAPGLPRNVPNARVRPDGINRAARVGLILLNMAI